MTFSEHTPENVAAETVFFSVALLNYERAGILVQSNTFKMMIKLFHGSVSQLCLEMFSPL